MRPVLSNEVCNPDARAFDALVQLGFDPIITRRVMSLVDHSEYKRRQAPPGVKITQRAFGRDRRLPITNTYHDEPEAPIVERPTQRGRASGAAR